MMRGSLLLLISILVGCDESSSVNTAPHKSTVFAVDTTNATVNKLLPSIRLALPGLDKYSEQFQNISVQQNYWLTIEFHIPDDANLPTDYMAFGHNCFIEINKEGTAIKVPKRPCKAIMLDRNADAIESEQWFDIASTKTEIPLATSSEKREILPPTSNNKPPKAGCLQIFSPNEETKWNCPVGG